MMVTDDRLVQGRDLLQLARAAQRGGDHGVTAPAQSRRPHGSWSSWYERSWPGWTFPCWSTTGPTWPLPPAPRGCISGPRICRCIWPGPSARRVSSSAHRSGLEAEAAPAAEADYWGVGPWRETTTKGDAGAALGTEGFRERGRAGARRPCIAIGGIRPVDVGPVVIAGGRRRGGGRRGYSGRRRRRGRGAASIGG